jgi:hypothetical protein
VTQGNGSGYAHRRSIAFGRSKPGLYKYRSHLGGDCLDKVTKCGSGAINVVLVKRSQPLQEKAVVGKLGGKEGV